jgi:hypothetical protein
MSELQRPTPRKNTEQVARDERLAKALRDNLLRRKEQKRARDRLAVPQSQAPDREREPPA